MSGGHVGIPHSTVGWMRNVSMECPINEIKFYTPGYDIATTPMELELDGELELQYTCYVKLEQ